MASIGDVAKLAGVSRSTVSLVCNNKGYVSDETRKKIEKAMKDFDYKSSGYELDLTQGRVFYFYHDTKRFWKYIRPVKKVK